jgi:hypothetical protein
VRCLGPVHNLVSSQIAPSMSPEIAPGKAGSSQWPIPAVVIGGELNGLGVCRSLARGDLRVCVVDCKRSSPAPWSRYACTVLTETLHGPALVGFMRDQGSRIEERPFLVVTDELALLTTRTRPAAPVSRPGRPPRGLAGRVPGSSGSATARSRYRPARWWSMACCAGTIRCGPRCPAM